MNAWAQAAAALALAACTQFTPEYDQPGRRTIYSYTAEPDALCRAFKSKSSVEIGACWGMIGETCIIFLPLPDLVTAADFARLKQHEDYHCRFGMYH